MTVRTKMQTAPRTRRRKGQALMGAVDPESVWHDDRCHHESTTLWTDGLCAAHTCDECGMRIDFVLRLGRPKKI